MSHAAANDQAGVRTGLPGVGTVPWGTHLCHFYRSVEDLRNPLVEFIRTGIENGEQCIWVTSQPLRASEARAALARSVPDLAELERSGQVTIFDFDDWYTAGGQLDPNTVIQQWIDNEQGALAQGYAGLRLTGNTSWLEPSLWDDFSAYEACAHEAFHGRRVLALCSYTLSRCSADEVLDVLRNHEFALVRQHGGWSLVRSATELLAAINTGGPPPESDHRARFFHENTYPADAIAAYLGEVPAGAAIALAPESHLDLIRSAMRRGGLDPAGVHMCDADRLMSEAAAGAIDLHATIRGLVEAATVGGRTAHAYGELVDVLSEQNNKPGALALEEFWNELLRDYDFKLWCGYDLAHFHPGDAEACTRLCACHNRLELDAPAEAEQVFAHALMEELTQRRDYEHERAQLLQAERRTSQRLSHLQRITSCLSEAVTQDDIVAVVAAELSTVAGAHKALLLVADERGALRVSRNEERDSLAVARAEDAFRDGMPRWVEVAADRDNASAQAQALSYAVLPLKLRSRLLGAVSLEFLTEQEFDSSRRALIEDICSQIGLALERARLYEEAERQRFLAEQAGRAKDQFIAMLGHELRNPLAALQNAAELLAVSGQSRELLGRTQSMVARQTSHMAKLIDDLLDVSRIIWGKIELHSTPLDFTALVDSVLEDHRAQVQRRAISLISDLGLAPVWVLGDRVRLVQIVDNVLANAIKFTPSGGTIKVSIRIAGKRVELKLCDNGTGIEPALLSRIFEPFQQAGQDLARTAGGLGLGLTLVKGLVDLHGGSIEVRSAGAGTGCEVKISLPSVAALAERSEPAAESSCMRRVLIVEDNRDAADALAQLLSLDGHAVAVAYDGPQALQRAADFKPDLVLCDVGLPGGMNGYEVAGALRLDESCAAVQLIALTGYGAPDDVVRAHASGFDQHLTKPVEYATLRAILAGL